MKASRKTLLALVGAMAVGAAMAAPSVEIVSVQQQYPWTNTVDIVYQVEGVTNMDYFVKFTPTTSAGVGIPDVNGQYDIQVALTNSGTYVAQWFPQTNQQYTACRMTPSVFRGAAKDYMIVDLLTGEVTYEPMATQAASNQRYNTQEYKTTKMVLRRVPAGNYSIQKGEATAKMEKDYYIGVFELTIGQYNAIMESGDTTSGYPISSISWNHVRGSALPTANIPDTGSGPLAKMNAKVHAVAGNADLYFDLPNEAMWEVAARANNPETWECIWGETSESTDDSGRGIGDYAWYRGNSSSKSEVGLRLPNAWGLYDMQGLLWEYCRDGVAHRTWNRDEIDLEGMSLTQTPSNGGSYTIIRGNEWNNPYASFYLSRRNSDRGRNNTNSCDGFRFALITK